MMKGFLRSFWTGFWQFVWGKRRMPMRELQSHDICLALRKEKL